MLATGARIGEALALRTGETAGRPLLDLDAGTWEVNATAVRVPKQGMVVQPRTKTAAGWRIIAVPAFAVDMVRRRLVEPLRPDTELVFPAPVAGTLRDPNSVSGDLRQLLDSFECDACYGTGLRPATSRSAAGRPVRCMRDRGRGSPRTLSARPSPPAWTRPGSPPGRSPTSSATPTLR
jgi:hypothetical protein